MRLIIEVASFVLRTLHSFPYPMADKKTQKGKEVLPEKVLLGYAILYPDGVFDYHKVPEWISHVKSEIAHGVVPGFALRDVGIVARLLQDTIAAQVESREGGEVEGRLSLPIISEDEMTKIHGYSNDLRLLAESITKEHIPGASQEALPEPQPALSDRERISPLPAEEEEEHVAPSGAAPEELQVKFVFKPEDLVGVNVTSDEQTRASKDTLQAIIHECQALTGTLDQKFAPMWVASFCWFMANEGTSDKLPDLAFGFDTKDQKYRVRYYQIQHLCQPTLRAVGRALADDICAYLKRTGKQTRVARKRGYPKQMWSLGFDCADYVSNLSPSQQHFLNNVRDRVLSQQTLLQQPHADISGVYVSQQRVLQMGVVESASSGGALQSGV